MLYPIASPVLPADPGGIMEAIGVMFHEIVVGLILGGIARLIVSTMPIAGSIIAYQSGLGFAQTADPSQSGVQGAIIGNFLGPRMMGESLNLDPLAVLLSLAIWGAIWGIPGMFLSAPLTVLVMIILSHTPGARWIAIILSADGRPSGRAKKAEKRLSTSIEPGE